MVHLCSLSALVISASTNAQPRIAHRITHFRAGPLSEAAEKLLGDFPIDPARQKIPLSDHLKILRNLRHLSKSVDSFEVSDPGDTRDMVAIKTLWAENQSMVTILFIKSFSEQLVSRIVPTMPTGNTVGLVYLYGQQLDLVENLSELDKEKPWKPPLLHLE